MPDFVSKKRLKKKVLERWENEGGNLSSDKAAAAHPPPKRKRKTKSGRASVGGA